MSAMGELPKEEEGGESKKPAVMSYDDVLKELGEFGRYQRRIYLLLCIAVIPCALHKLAGFVLGASPEFRCLLPYEESNTTTFFQNETIQSLTRVRLREDLWDSCRSVDANFTEEYFINGVPANGSVPCQEWVFDQSSYKSSSVIEFLLVCNRAWMSYTADSLLMFGVLAGSYIFGDLSDRFGRRPTFIISLVLQLISGLLTALAPEYFSFVLGRIIVGATTSGVFLVAYVIALEMVGPSKRLVAGTFIHMFFSISFFLTALFAYLTEDSSWRVFQVIITLVPGAFLMSYWWIIPESSRWLASQGRHEEAKNILLNIAKENGVKLPESSLNQLLSPTSEAVTADSNFDEDLEESALERGMEERDVDIVSTGAKAKKRQPNLMDLMIYPTLRKRSLNIFFSWFVCSLAYYGLSWSTGALAGNRYINFCLSGLMEFPGYGILLLTLNRFGRKITLCGSLISGGVALLLTLAVPGELKWLTITLAMLGKLGITTAYGTVYVFSTEQFPTVIRNVALGAASMSARIGGISAPFINGLSHTWKPLPLIVYGGLALCAGGLALLMPETLNRTLPETIEEGEAFREAPKIKKSKTERSNGVNNKTNDS